MFRRLAPLVAPAAALLLALGAALPAAAARPFPDRIELPPGWQPEGITAGRGTTVYVGSLATGAIWQGDVRTGRGDTLVDPVGAPAVGIDYERGANRIWVAGGDTGQVRVYDAATGDPLATYQFGPTGFINDIVVTRDAVYATDSNIQQLLVVPLGPGGALPASGFVLPLSGEIDYAAGQFNANGIVATRGWLILVQSFNGKLFRVDPGTGEAFEIDAPAGAAASGDGLELHGARLHVIRNFPNTVTTLRLGPGLRSARVVDEVSQADDGIDVDIPTTGAWVAGSLYVVNARFTTPPTSGTAYWITRVP
jgi:hypothetical protein